MDIFFYILEEYMFSWKNQEIFISLEYLCNPNQWLHMIHGSIDNLVE